MHLFDVEFYCDIFLDLDTNLFNVHIWVVFEQTYCTIHFSSSCFIAELQHHVFQFITRIASPCISIQSAELRHLAIYLCPYATAELYGDMCDSTKVFFTVHRTSIIIFCGWSITDWRKLQMILKRELMISEG